MSSDEKKNQGAVAGTRDPLDPRAPQCNATKEELRADGLKIGDVCPVCDDFGKKVRVGAHPSQPAATTARRGRKKRKRNQSPKAPVSENKSENNTPEQNKMSYLDSFVNWAFGSSSDAKKNLATELGNENAAASANTQDQVDLASSSHSTPHRGLPQPDLASSSSQQVIRRRRGNRL